MGDHGRSAGRPRSVRGARWTTFFHFVAVFMRTEGGEWSEVDRLEIESAPQRTQVELLTTGWGGAGRRAVGLDCGARRHRSARRNAGRDWVRRHGTVSTALSRITQRQYLSEFLDLDGDGLLEVVLNDSGPLHLLLRVCHGTPAGGPVPVGPARSLTAWNCARRWRRATTGSSVWWRWRRRICGAKRRPRLSMRRGRFQKARKSVGSRFWSTGRRWRG